MLIRSRRGELALQDLKLGLQHVDMAFEGAHEGGLVRPDGGGA